MQRRNHYFHKKLSTISIKNGFFSIQKMQIFHRAAGGRTKTPPMPPGHTLPTPYLKYIHNTIPSAAQRAALCHLNLARGIHCEPSRDLFQIDAVSGLFCRARGMLLGWQLAYWIGGSFAATAVGDLFLSLRIASQEARYYALHAFGNAIIVILIAPDVFRFLSNPLAGLEGEYTDAPLAMTVGLHIFHCASQAKKLTAVDWAHHLISNMLVSFLCFPFRYGPIINWACLFVCGLPGGIDYFLLFLVKIGRLEKGREKSCNRMLNMWVRLPGIVSFVPFAFVCYQEGRASVHGGLMIAQSLLNCFNGIYFADRVVANHAVFAERSKTEAKAANGH